ncbi:choice-of-anchor I family protein [Halobacillus yeomjeoni]|uniref:choice-of-anchor I family protein n=1 Tax=Halobacillus yeomjeoni TaxID=311194 RepID=UPI001CD64A27|nr:choice-of-anchor I family protein [Halobacillus yeomjeoni]MCA0983407.1 choice-of-anchor I family protein [Halobacillus yeomjeoni]
MNKKKVLVPALLAMIAAPTTSLAAEDVNKYPEYSNGDNLTISVHGRYDSGAGLDEGGAEILDYDSNTQRVFVVNGADQSLDILTIGKGEGKGLKLHKKIMLSNIDLGTFQPGDLTSVSVHPTEPYVAVAIPNKQKTDNGVIAFFTTDGDFIDYEKAGALPDMVTFTPDGNQLLVANEGEPDDTYSTDPEGSITLMDVSKGLKNRMVDTIDFTSLTEEQIDEDVRIYSPGASHAEDFEPEYIQVTPDGKKAYVSLQENNAVAELDLVDKEVTHIHGLGFKDHSLEGNGIDASNTSSSINIQPAPVLGMHQPDGIALFSMEGENYVLTPNEGDARDYDGFSEEVRIKDLIADPDRDIHLDASYYEGYSQKELDQMVEDGLWNDDQLGRLKVTSTMGQSKDGSYQALYSYGSRSFSVYETDDFSRIYDSGNEFENVTSEMLPEHFNASNDTNEKKDRSDDKGPEPETATTGVINGKTYAFIGLERQCGIMVYNVDEPEQPKFVTYFTTRDFSAEDGSVKGDSGPEGLKFIAGDQSPTGKPLLLVSHEVTGTTVAYELSESFPFASFEPAQGLFSTFQSYLKKNVFKHQ